MAKTKEYVKITLKEGGWLMIEDKEKVLSIHPRVPENSRLGQLKRKALDIVLQMEELDG